MSQAIVESTSEDGSSYLEINESDYFLSSTSVSTNSSTMSDQLNTTTNNEMSDQINNINPNDQEESEVTAPLLPTNFSDLLPLDQITATAANPPSNNNNNNIQPTTNLPDINIPLLSPNINITPTLPHQTISTTEINLTLATSDQLDLLNNLEPTETFPHWKSILLSSLDDLLQQLVNHPRFRPSGGGVNSVYDYVLHTNFEDDIDSVNSELNNNNMGGGRGSGDSSNSNSYKLKPGQFGKLGHFVGTQVFEFDLWDQFESVKSPKFPVELFDVMELRSLLSKSNDIPNLTAPQLLNPLLNLLDSGHSSSQIVNSSLSTLIILLTNTNLLFHSDIKQIIPALDRLSEAISKCQFHPSDQNQDEVVLIKLIKVMNFTLTIKNITFRLNFNRVVNVLSAMLSVITKVKLSLTGRFMMEGLVKDGVVGLISNLLELNNIKYNENEEGSDKLGNVLLIIIDLLQPNSTSHSNYMRLFGLTLIQEIIQTHGQSLLPTKINKSNQSHIAISDTLFKYLWLLQDGDHLPIINQSIQLTKTLLTIRPNIFKQQLQLILQQVINRLVLLSTSPNHNGPYRQNRDDELSFIFNSFLMFVIGEDDCCWSELLVNFDGVVNMPNLLVDLVVYFVDCCIGELSMGSRDGNKRGLCMDVIFKFLLGLCFRGGLMEKFKGDGVLLKLTMLNQLHYQPKTIKSTISNIKEYTNLTPNELTNNQRHKKILLEAVNHFNQKPQLGINYLIEMELLPKQTETNKLEFSKQFSKILHSTLGWNKKLLGELLSKRDSTELLIAFVDEFDFHGKRLDVAMRMFLTSFRLPGESQIISRIFEVFSEHYIQTKPEFIDNADAVYVLAYSILMINTDLHNPQVRNKIKLTGFQSMHRNTNNGKAFDEGFLSDIYNTIANDEIILPDEREGIVSKEYTWQLYINMFNEPYLHCQSGQFDKELFIACSNLLIDMFIQIYSSANNDSHLQTSLQGLHLILTLSNYFQLNDPIDHTLRQLITLTGPIYSTPNSTNDITLPRIPVANRTQKIDSNNLILSDLTFSLGQSYRTQLITLFLINVTIEIPNGLFNAWWDVLDVVRLFVDSYLVDYGILSVPWLGQELDDKGDVVLGRVTLPYNVIGDDDGILDWRFNNNSNSNELISSEMKRNNSQSSTNSNNTNNINSGGGLFSTVSNLFGYNIQQPTLIWDQPLPTLQSYHTSVNLLTPRLNFNKLILSFNNLDDDNFVQVCKRIMIILKRSHNITSFNSEVKGEIESIYLPSTSFFINLMVNSAIKCHSNSLSLLISFLGDVLYHAEYYHRYIITQTITQLIIILHNELPNPNYDNKLSENTNLILDLFNSLSPIVIKQSISTILLGFNYLHNKQPNILQYNEYWQTILQLLQFGMTLDQQNNNKLNLINLGFPILQRLIETIHFNCPIDLTIYLSLVNLLIELGNPDRFIKSSKDNIDLIVNRSLLAIEYLGGLCNKLILIVNNNNNLNGRGYYLPLLIGLSSLANHRRDLISELSFNLLKRSIASNSLKILVNNNNNNKEGWKDIIDRVVVPFVDLCIESELNNINNKFINRTRAVGLLSNVFLNYLSSSILNNNNDINIMKENDFVEYKLFSNIWLNVLDVILKLIILPNNISEDEEEREGINEPIKNMFLVLISTGLLLPPNNNNISDNEFIVKTSIHTWGLVENSLPWLINLIVPNDKINESEGEVALLVVDDKENSEVKNDDDNVTMELKKEEVVNNEDNSNIESEVEAKQTPSGESTIMNL